MIKVIKPHSFWFNLFLTYFILYRLDFDKYFIDKLTVDHIDYVANYWTDKNKDVSIIKKYLQHTLTVYNYSFGIFLMSNPCNPVSWVAFSDYGNSVFLYTIPEYRNKGLSGNVISYQYIKLLEDGIIPLWER